MKVKSFKNFSEGRCGGDKNLDHKQDDMLKWIHNCAKSVPHIYIYIPEVCGD